MHFTLVFQAIACKDIGSVDLGPITFVISQYESCYILNSHI